MEGSTMDKKEVKDFIIQYIRDVIGIELPQEIKDYSKKVC